MVTTIRKSSPFKKLFTGGRLRTPQSNNVAPLAAFSLSVPQGRAFSICALALYFFVLNLSGVFFQLRGVAPDHHIFSVLSTFCGALGGGLLMDAVERHSSGPCGKVWRGGLFAALILPGVFGLIAFALTDFSGNLFLNSVQPALWALPLAPTLRVFFRHESSPASRAVWFGLAFGAGHLCWALVLPLARFMMGPGVAENSTLVFLNITRCLLVFVLGCLTWKALESLIAQGPGTRPDLPIAPGPSSRQKIMFLLLAFLPCVLLNGTIGFVLFARSTTHGAFPELGQIGMAFLFPLTGLWLAGRAGRLLPLLSAFVLCFVLAPALLPDSVLLPSWLRQMALFLCITGLQGLYFCGILYMATLGPYLSRPSLALISVSTIPVTALAVPGLRALLKDFPSFNQWFCFALALACIGSVLLLRRVFPLPETPSFPSENDAGAFSLADTTKLHVFAATFQLTKRETEVLNGILRGQKREAISAELGISERTAKFHIRGLLQKTSMPNRQRLLHYYTAWQTE